MNASIVFLPHFQSITASFNIFKQKSSLRICIWTPFLAICQFFGWHIDSEISVQRFNVGPHINLSLIVASVIKLSSIRMGCCRTSLKRFRTAFHMTSLFQQLTHPSKSGTDDDDDDLLVRLSRLASGANVTRCVLWGGLPFSSMACVCYPRFCVNK